MKKNTLKKQKRTLQNLIYNHQKKNRMEQIFKMQTCSKNLLPDIVLLSSDFVTLKHEKKNVYIPI